MKEAEFKQRIETIKTELTAIYSWPGMNSPAYDRLRLHLHTIAADVSQIESGIITYSRPSNWDLIEEGIPSADSGTKTPKMS